MSYDEETMNALKLDIDVLGIMKVFTRNSLYTVNFNAGTILRENTEDNNPIRRDGEALRIISMDRPVVGDNWDTFVDVREDGIPTYRSTSTVLAVEGIEEWDKWHDLITSE